MNENMPIMNNEEEKDFQKKVAKENKSNLMKKGVLGVMLGAATAASSMDSGNAAEDFKTLNATDTIETTVEETVKNTEDTANPFNIEPDKEGLYKNSDTVKPNFESNKEGDKETEPKKEDSKFEDAKETIVVVENGVANITTFFPESDASLTPEGVEKVQTAVRSLFDNATKEQMDGLKEGSMKVVAYSESSQTEVRKGGSPQKDGSILIDNYEFSLKRGNNTFDVTDNIFDEYGIQNAEREIEIAQEKGYKRGTTSKNTREVRISIELVDMETTGFNSEKIIEELPNGKIKLLIGDGSNSFEGKMGQFYQSAKDNGLTEGTVDFIVASGKGELSEKVKIGSQRDVNLQENYLKNQQEFSDDEDMVSNILLAAEKMPLVKYEDRIENEPGLFVMGTDEKITISKSQLERMIFQENARDAKIVLLMENRDTGEVTTLTTDKMISILDSYNIEDDNERITIDVNNEKIGGGSADVVINNNLEKGSRDAIASN